MVGFKNNRSILDHSWLKVEALKDYVIMSALCLVAFGKNVVLFLLFCSAQLKNLAKNLKS